MFVVDELGDMLNSVSVSMFDLLLSGFTLSGIDWSWVPSPSLPLSPWGAVYFPALPGGSLLHLISLSLSLPWWVSPSPNPPPRLSLVMSRVTSSWEHLARYSAFLRAVSEGAEKEECFRAAMFVFLLDSLWEREEMSVRAVMDRGPLSGMWCDEMRMEEVSH